MPFLSKREIFILSLLNSPISLIYGANVVLPSSPISSSIYNLPGSYGGLGDIFYLQSNFNAPTGSLPAITLTGLSTFILDSNFTITQLNGGTSGVASFRAVVLAKGGGTIQNYGSIVSLGSTAVDTFGMMASSQGGTSSSYAYNYGTINMRGNSTDGMDASGTATVRSYAFNQGTIFVADNVSGATNWVTGMSGVGNGMVVNGANGTINATSNAGSRGSNGLFGGYNVPSYSGTNAFSSLDPQMINLGIINSSGDSHGFYYWGNNKTFAQNDGIVNITGRGHGFYFDNVDNVTTGGGSAGLNNLTGVINTAGANSYGMYLRFGNNLIANNLGRIETSGARAHGIVAFSSGSYGTNFARGSIITNGDTSAGIYYSANALNDLNHKWNLGSITVNGSNSFGIATPQNRFRNDGVINVTGSNSFGMLAGGSYNLSVDSSISNNTNLGGLTSLSASQGAAQTALNFGLITAAGTSTIGLAAQGSGSLAINENNAIVNAFNTGIGMYAQNEGALQNNGLVAATADSVAVSLNNGSLQNNGSILSSNIGITGTNGSRIEQEGRLSGTINAVKFDTGNNLLNLRDGSITIGNISMGTGVDRTYVYEGANISQVPLFDGVSSTSFLNFEGYNGPVGSVSNWQEVTARQNTHLSLDSSHDYQASLFIIDESSALSFGSQTGSLVGEVFNQGLINLSAGIGNGQYVIQGSFVNAGEIRLAGLANVAGNGLTVSGDYTGLNGFLTLNSFLQGDRAPSDILTLNGGRASGNTGVNVTNAGGLGAITFSDGILVVNAINGGITEEDAFYLATPAISGPYEYRLYRSDLAGLYEHNWYLRNLCPPEDPACSPEPDNPSIAEYRSEVGLYPVLPAMTYLYGQMLIDNLHEREGLGTKGNRIWSRLVGLHGERERLRIRQPFRSAQYDYNFSLFQVGGTLLEAETQHEWRHYLGLLGGVGQANGDVKRPNFRLGSNRFDALSIGGYWTLYSPNKAYLDIVLQETWYEDMLSKSYRLPSLETHGNGFGGSIEGGYPFYLQKNWLLEPQVQAIYQSININDGRDIGASIRFRNNYGTATRLGLRLSYQWKLPEEEYVKGITAWFRPNYWYQFGGKPEAQFSSSTGFIPFAAQLEGATSQFNLGLTVDLPKNIAFYANGSYGLGLTTHLISYDGIIGIKVMMN